MLERSSIFYAVAVAAVLMASPSVAEVADFGNIPTSRASGRAL